MNYFINKHTSKKPIMSTISEFAISQKNTSESIVHLKLVFSNYNGRYTNLFIDPKIKAILHYKKRCRPSTSKIKIFTLQLKDIQTLYNTYKLHNLPDNLAAHICCILLCRADTVLNPRFKIVKIDDQYYELQFPTKTTYHKIIIKNKIRTRILELISVAEHLNYSKYLRFTKQKYSMTTHQFRKAGASFLREEGLFTENDIKVYGHWANVDICSQFYLKDLSLRRIADFYENIL